jgi:hypothetical protein
MPRKNKTFAQILAKTWTSEIGFSGYDPVDKTINGKPVSYNQRKEGVANLEEDYDVDYEGNEDAVGSPGHEKRRDYRNSIGLQVAAFFLKPFTGMRNDTSNVALTLLKNMVWWPEADAPTWQRILQFVGMTIGLVTLITPAYVLLSLVGSVLMNSLKIAAKFLPKLWVNGFDELRKRVKDRLDSTGELKPGRTARFGLNVADLLLSMISGVPIAWHFIGSAITSPIDAARMAYKKGGFWAAALSGTTSVLTYAIGLPILFAYVGVHFPAIYAETIKPFFTETILPYLTAHAPWLANAGTAVGSFLEASATAVFGAEGWFSAAGWVGQSLSWMYTTMIEPSTFLTGVVNTFNFGMAILSGQIALPAAMPLISGLGVALAVTATTIGTALDLAWKSLSNAFVNNKREPGPDVAMYPSIDEIVYQQGSSARHGKGGLGRGVREPLLGFDDQQAELITSRPSVSKPNQSKSPVVGGDLLVDEDVSKQQKPRR